VISTSSFLLLASSAETAVGVVVEADTVQSQPQLVSGEVRHLYVTE
jgi:hypothetical protein